MTNPLASPLAATTDDDARLVTQAQQGDRDALDRLIRLHRPFIYNVAWKMVHDPHDAADLTQETLIKVITKLGQFDGKSAFRTWLYRIVVNEFLQTKRRSRETIFESFDKHAAGIDALPNPDVTAEERLDLAEASKEMRMRCMSGMLLCMTREQRLLIILGQYFGIDHTTGAEIFETTKANYRVKLHRARQQLYNYMNDKCGLVNRANPCRCPKKAKALSGTPALDPATFQFARGYRNTIAEYVAERHEEAEDAFEQEYVRLFREHPAKTDFPDETVLGELLDYFEVS